MCTNQTHRVLSDLGFPDGLRQHLQLSMAQWLEGEIANLNVILKNAGVEP